MTHLDPQENREVKHEMKQVIRELKNQGVNMNSTEEEIMGLGDLVENTLNKFGITQDRFKQWFNLRACKCDERKKWLNNLFSWKIKGDSND